MCTLLLHIFTFPVKADLVLVLMAIRWQQFLHVSPLVSQAIVKEVEITEIIMNNEIKRTFSEDPVSEGWILFYFLCPSPNEKPAIFPLTSLK